MTSSKPKVVICLNYSLQLLITLVETFAAATDSINSLNYMNFDVYPTLIIILYFAICKYASFVNSGASVSHCVELSLADCVRAVSLKRLSNTVKHHL